MIINQVTADPGAAAMVGAQREESRAVCKGHEETHRGKCDRPREYHAPVLQEGEGRAANMVFPSLRVIIPSKVYDSPDLPENEATFAIGPQGIMNADG